MKAVSSSIVDLVLNIVKATWVLCQQMAPYLLLGFLMAGVVSEYIPVSWVRKHLKGRGFREVVKAVLFGIPLPLCSCGVIPVAQMLRRQGASKGAASAFLVSTPQTGVDSILATYGLMGFPFMAARVVADFFSGIFCGLMVNGLVAQTETAAEHTETPAEVEKETCGESNGCCSSDDAACCDNNRSGLSRMQRIFTEGFIVLPRDLAWPLLFGLIIGGVLTVLFPEGILAGVFKHSVLSLMAVTVLSIPLYVCATGSIPLAYGLMAAGFSPGAALVFLITGPATNSATITTLVKMLGKRGMLIHLSTLIVSAWCFGYLFDTIFSGWTMAGTHKFQNEGTGAFHLWSAVILLIFMGVALLPAESLRFMRSFRWNETR